MSTVINLILAESSIELVPREIWNHPVILKHARKRKKRPGEMLLDISLHYFAMRNLSMREKRGRPDIVHISLLNALSSPLNIVGKLRVYIHTLNDYVIFVNPATRIPRNYNRFVGLIEQLLIEGKVPPDADKPLMYVKPLSFRNLLRELGFDGAILLSEKGRLVKPEDICRLCVERGLPIVIGGFPHGDFSNEVKSLTVEAFSIFPKPLDTWVVVSRVIEGCERILGIYEFK
ncbi:MAG TPA: 16S rRNA methyltransferase [Acidilobales archaeon]|nr:MAG: 16S rRNA methyltransferase [Desulfurococcales archaeon ex4484_217_2]HDD26678.1 16S rRNA methyltransferase [Acidilobales archaeon]